MRIGTWNLQGRWDQRHLDHITTMGCDVLPQLPTAGSPHQIEGLLSIDHLAVPIEWEVARDRAPPLAR